MNGNDQQYEMVPSQEWSRNDHSLPRTEIHSNPSNVQNVKSYTLPSLDADWYPILANKLTPRPVKNEIHQDETDLGTKQYYFFALKTFPFSQKFMKFF